MGGPPTGKRGAEPVLDPIVFALANVRRSRGITQLALAAKLHTQQSVISTWESGTATPTLYSLRRWADALDYTLAIIPGGGS